MSDLSKKSKFIARVLRHDPSLIEVELDEGGWVSEADLLNGMRGAGIQITRKELGEIISLDEKGRFTREGIRIRAAQGHSIPVDLGLVSVKPPATLWYGADAASLSELFKRGLERRKRNHVQLHGDIASAQRFGQRHGSPVVVKVDAEMMASIGFEFYRSENGVWLTQEVPASFLSHHTDGGEVAA